MAARSAEGDTGSRGLALITIVGGAIGGGAIAFSVATSDLRAPAMPEQLTLLIWYAIRVAGVSAYLTLWATTLAGLAISAQVGGRWIPGALLYPLHQLGDLALSLAVLHAALLLGDHYAGFTPASLVVPFTATYRPLYTGFGILALYVSAIVFWSVHLRPRIGYRAWRTVHYASLAAFALALVHGLAAGTDSAWGPMRLMYLVTGQSVVLLVALRLWKSRAKPGTARAAA